MKRGEIWIVDLDPGYGKEIRKKRPALVITSDSFNKSLHTVVVIPFSSRAPKIISAEMVIVVPSRENGLDKKSVLLPLLLRSVDKSRLINKIGNLSEDKVFEVEGALKIVLGLEPLE